MMVPFCDGGSLPVQVGSWAMGQAGLVLALQHASCVLTQLSTGLHVPSLFSTA
jgi:hypothetical protein